MEDLDQRAHSFMVVGICEHLTLMVDGSMGWLIHSRFLGLRWTYRSLYLPLDTMLVSWQTIKPFRVNSPTSKPKLPKSLMKRNNDHHGSRPWWLLPFGSNGCGLGSDVAFHLLIQIIFDYLSQYFCCWQVCCNYWQVCCIFYVKLWLAGH